MSIQPGVTGTPLKNFDGGATDIYVLGVTDPESPLKRELFAIDKESLFQGAFQDLDISEDIFNNPKYKTSYQDIVPNTWKSLPNLNLIHLEYNLNWIVDYRRNPNIGENINGVQTVSTFTGYKFIRYGLDGNWTKWQLVSQTPIGALAHLIVPEKYRGLNRLGWLPLSGITYSKQMYPDLYLLIRDVFESDTDSFTLPDARGSYLRSLEGEDVLGSVNDWVMPDITDTLDFVKGSYYNKSLFKEMTQINKLFLVKDKDDSTTTSAYLNNDSIINLNNADPVEGDQSGLTSELKLDLKNRLGKKHVSTDLRPKSFVSSDIYIYAGYPQN